jgi:hypothetical protein
MGDPNMGFALAFGQLLQYRPLPFPVPLADVQARAKFILAIDKPLLVDGDGIHQWREFGIHLEEIAERSEAVMTDLHADFDRVSIALRLWAGCVTAVKSIRPETRSGQNITEGRAQQFQSIDELAADDPVYAAGVELAPAFLDARSPVGLASAPPRQRRAHQQLGHGTVGGPLSRTRTQLIDTGLKLHALRLAQRSTAPIFVRAHRQPRAAPRGKRRSDPVDRRRGLQRHVSARRVVDHVHANICSYTTGAKAFLARRPGR